MRIDTHKGIDWPDLYIPQQARSRGGAKGWNIIRWNKATGLFHGWTWRKGEFTIEHWVVWAEYKLMFDRMIPNYEYRFANWRARRQAFSCASYTHMIGHGGVELYPTDHNVPDLLDLWEGKAEPTTPAICPICERPTSWDRPNVQRIGATFHAWCWDNRPLASDPPPRRSYYWSLILPAPTLSAYTCAELERILSPVAPGCLLFYSKSGNLVAHIPDQGIAWLMAQRVDHIAPAKVERTYIETPQGGEAEQQAA